MVETLLEILAFLVNYIEYLLLFAGILLLSYTDFRYLMISDWVQMLILVSGILQLYQPSAFGTVIGPLLGYIAGYMLYMDDFVGYGDVKLLAAFGAWLGFWIFFAYLLADFFFIALVKLYKLRGKKKKGYPFGPPIALASVVTFFVSNGFYSVI